MGEQKITVPAVGTNPGFTATQTYTYDSLNRMQSATESISGTQTWKQTFSIDRYGIRRFDAANTTTLGSCNASVCNPEINTSDNRLKKDQPGGSAVDYDYDANGALTKDFTGQRFGYDAESHQKEFFSASNQTTTPDATYHYDGDGRRVKKVVGTEVTIFVYDAGGQLSAEYSTTVAPVEQAKVSYLTTDHLGSPRIITDRDGRVISRRDFAAFGDEVISSQRVGGTNGNGYDPPNVRQDYTGYQKDSESGLEFAQARYYNTGHGRFTSVDPLTASATIRNPQTFNRYTYVLNSPYEFSDPLGLMPGGHCNTGRCIGITGKLFWGEGGAQTMSARPASQVIQQQPQQAQSTSTLSAHEALHSNRAAPPPQLTAEQNGGTENSVNDSCRIRTVSEPGQTMNNVTTTAPQSDKTGPKTRTNENGNITDARYTFQVEAEVSGNPDTWHIEQKVYKDAEVYDTTGTRVIAEKGLDPYDAPEVPSNIFRGTVNGRTLVNWADSPGPVDVSRGILRGHVAINGISTVRKGITVCSTKWSIVQTFNNGVVSRNQFNPGRYVVQEDYGDYQP